MNLVSCRLGREFECAEVECSFGAVIVTRDTLCGRNMWTLKSRQKPHVATQVADRWRTMCALYPSSSVTLEMSPARWTAATMTRVVQPRRRKREPSYFNCRVYPLAGSLHCINNKREATGRASPYRGITMKVEAWCWSSSPTIRAKAEISLQGTGLQSEKS